MVGSYEYIYIYFIFISSIFLQSGIDNEVAFIDDTYNYEFLPDIDRFIENYRNLFDEVPFQPLLYSMLERKIPSKILSIDFDITSPYVVIKSNKAYTYIIGTPRLDQLDDVFEEISHYNQIILICNESIQPYFLQHGFNVQSRLMLARAADYQSTIYTIPTGLIIQPLDSLDLFLETQWSLFLSSLYGSAESFIDKGFGFVLMNEDGVIISQSYTVAIGNGLCEIGVVTNENFRGNGYAIHVIQALIDECLRRNLIPMWNCDADNIASYKTALKFGFKIKRNYQFLKKIRSQF